MIVQVSASAPALLRSPSVLEQSAGPRPLAVEVLDRHGRIVARSLTLGGQTLQVGDLIAAAIEHGRSGYANATLGDDQMRVYAAPLPALGGPASGGAVIVAGTTDDLSSTLSESRALIVLSAIAAALLVVPIAYVLAGRALGPLRELAAAAEVIESRGDPAMRLPATGGERSPDEVARLGDTLNRMLSALERARDRERRFVADASHELRNPLTALRGNAAYLARNGADRAALRDLQEDADRLARLVDELLALAREESTPLPDEPVRLDRLAEPLGDEQVAVHAGDPGWVRGRRGRTRARAREPGRERAPVRPPGRPDRRLGDAVGRPGRAGGDRPRRRDPRRDRRPGHAALLARRRRTSIRGLRPGAGAGARDRRAARRPAGDRRQPVRHRPPCSQTALRRSGYNRSRRFRPRYPMNILRRISTTRLIIAVILIAAASAVTAYAVTNRSGPRPPARPLAVALQRSLAARPVPGVTARIAFTNHLFPSGALGGSSSPLLTGADGRLWAGGGRVRLELEAATGDTEIGWDGRTLVVYDVSSNTVYRMAAQHHGRAATAWSARMSVTAPKGFVAAGVHAGIRRDHKDVALLHATSRATGAAMWTQNRVLAAPVVVSKAHLERAQPQAVVVNSGDANAATGAQGVADAIATAEHAAHAARPRRRRRCSSCRPA